MMSDQVITAVLAILAALEPRPRDDESEPMRLIHIGEQSALRRAAKQIEDLRQADPAGRALDVRPVLSYTQNIIETQS